VDELPELLRRGEIEPHHQVRSGFGAVLGTVDDLMSGRVTVSSSSPSEPSGAPPVQAHSRGSTHMTVSVIIVVLLSVIGLLMLPMCAGSHFPPTAAMPTTTTAMAVIMLERTSDSTGQSVQVRLADRVAHARTVQVMLRDALPGIRLSPADGHVVIAPSETSARIRVELQRSDPRPVKVELHAELVDGTVRVASAPLILTMQVFSAPSIAREPFLPSDLSSGWSTPWNGALTVVSESLGTQADLEGITSYGRLAAEGSDWVSASRSLQTTWSRGHLWLSLVLEPVVGADGLFPWGEVMLTTNDQPRIGLTMHQSPGSDNQWCLSAPQARKEDRIEQRFVRPFKPTRVVIRIDLGENSSSALCWLNPIPAVEPRGIDAISLLSLPPMTINGFRVAGSGSAVLRLADLRIGRVWNEVVPAW